MSAAADRFANASCHGKRKYETWTAAERGVTGLKFQKGLDSAMQPYSCNFCGKFHVGHAPQQQKRPKTYDHRKNDYE